MLTKRLLNFKNKKPGKVSEKYLNLCNIPHFNDQFRDISVFSILSL